MSDQIHTALVPNGEALLVTHLETIERVIAFVCARQRLSRADADEFSSHVKLKLIEDDYAIFRKFEQRSSLRTYLTVVIQRLVLDYRTSSLGKWRPSSEAKRRGVVAVLLEPVRDGHTFEEACELLQTNHRVTIDRAELERLAAALPTRTKRSSASEDVLEILPAADPLPDELVGRSDRETLVRRVLAIVRRAIGTFDTQDRLILTLRFEDDQKVSVIASMLRLDQAALYRRLERLLKELRKCLEAEGSEGAAVMEMLQSSSVNIQETETTEESLGERPSVASGGRQWR